MVFGEIDGGADGDSNPGLMAENHLPYSALGITVLIYIKLNTVVPIGAKIH